jgi:hypothetical protein
MLYPCSYCKRNHSLAYLCRPELKALREKAKFLDEALAALQETLKRSCECYSNIEKDWHAKDCFVPSVKAVLKKAGR